jgi:hypothetical protein
LPVTATVELATAAPVQVGLFGPNSPNVIVPVGLNPPDRTAESLTGLPAGTEPDAVVTIAGDTGPTAEDSFAAPQPDVTGALFESPLYATTHS